MMWNSDYSETPLGPLPPDWKVTNIRELADVKYGKANPKSEGSIPVVGSGGIFDWTDVSFVNFPTIVVGRKGTAGRAWLMAGPSYPSDTTFYLDWKREVDIYFLYGYLNLDPLSGEHAKTTLPSLTRPDLENKLVPLPPLPEQRAIAHVLTTVRSAIEATERVIAATRELKRSMMKHLFTYGPVSIDQADKVPLKETEIGEVPEDWHLLSLGEIATLQRGKDLPRNKRIPGKYPVVGSNGIVGYHFEYVAHGPGVFVGRSGSVGQVTRIKEDYWPLNTTLWVKDFHNNDENFVYYLLTMFDFGKYTAGVSVPTLNRNLVHPVIVGLPSSRTQKRIASMLDNVENKLLTEFQRKSALESLFNSLLHHLMTGKVRVNKLNIFTNMEGKS